ncbi:hypothetical protein RBH29_08660 [Herbivorax sp. ANBcel31]|uniref:hypothetical protein n=1 Tax=Herbivorax sp. ANBcel31 TaxID=3069754 RepID=UPI0027B08003|nr:hypothetical protein [Herbivorax sp. ANBcel31]MDQ2086497.1 hypothetical protein [Herbivorax sp. ANBcel31]
MNTVYKDFSIQSLQKDLKNNEFQGLINFRQGQHIESESYKKIRTEVEELINELSKRSDQLKIEESINLLECELFEAAYKAALADLMTAMTFNKLGVTMVEYLK